ncbi:DUF4624 family lipoprotein [Clostridioides difficile]|uniref:Lipoprotein n=4 Tax=Clostridioides difficile TaxID=1496 RepID=A0AAX3GVF7_CLODI|nr:DUF4624 family lipoprotein [Clostridioides difficile]AVD35063.1 DUF4624 domain-containing lipoprotein [Clostridioides difficile]AVD38076.1 DUF4624 domain-containing lipoprotein [Clostridioides difficile]AVD41605.1 DUF4624 domain-containing lipoprotein [Clostridioides difficile]AXU68130.1 lipoprotein [Clostridioides difficile]AXU90301.1 lipoprotein [Clostridioides difficile]
MKKLVIILISIINVVSLTACKKSNESKYNNLNNKESGQTTIEMELDKNYDTSDSFVNARLFCVSNDIDVLETEISFQMDGDSGIVEIKDNKTDETLWSNTWHGRVDNDTFTISLANIQKEKEYAIWFTGIKINHAIVKVSFESNLVKEKEIPSK